MKFNIEEYFNSLPDDVIIINVKHKKLTYLPDLSRFYKLETLTCSNNRLTELPPLNPSLQNLFCSENHLTQLPELNISLRNLVCCKNRLTWLPELNPNLKFLNCVGNKLTVLPKLNPKLNSLYCSGNKLESMPLLNDKLEVLYFANNPIYNVVSFKITKIDYIKKNIQTIYNFKYLFYSLKFKNKFRDWLWVKVREPKIKEYYSPANLQKLLSGVDEDNFEQLDNLLSNW